MFIYLLNMYSQPFTSLNLRPWNESEAHQEQEPRNYNAIQSNFPLALWVQRWRFPFHTSEWRVGGLTRLYFKSVALWYYNKTKSFMCQREWKAINLTCNSSNKDFYFLCLYIHKRFLDVYYIPTMNE